MNSRSSVVLMAAFILALRLVAVNGVSSDDYLVPHNAARAAVGVAPLSWSSDLESYALGYAQSQVNQCLPLQHSHGPYGENLFWGSGKEWTPEEAVTAWTDEVEDYDYETNSCTAGKMCGHYTQVVWANTTQVKQKQNKTMYSRA